MLNFYKKALFRLALILLFSLCFAVLCLSLTFKELNLLPLSDSPMPWDVEIGSDIENGGQSSVTLNDDRFSLGFDFTIRPVIQYPFVNVGMVFKDRQGNAQHVDLSSYETITFRVRCEPSNVLAFSVFTVEEQVTKPADINSYKTPQAFFSCTENWSKIELDLAHLEVPDWWFDHYDQELSKKDYDLHQVARFAINSSYQSPSDQNLNVLVEDMQLKGRDSRYLYLLAIVLACVWLTYAFWFFRGHSKALIADLQNKIKQDRPLVAYQQLNLEPRTDKDRSAILRYLGTEYAKPELSLDMASADINITRAKINEILKEEIGYTFSSYLNKLRLTEAARLLVESPATSVAEVAYSVGYKNPSYFIKLFKDEYGCTPKTFRSLQG
jgi:AraC-like DNA-binding protein